MVVCSWDWKPPHCVVSKALAGESALRIADASSLLLPVLALVIFASTHLLQPGLPAAGSLCWKLGQGWLSEIFHRRGEKLKVGSYTQDCPAGEELDPGTKTISDPWGLSS